MFYDLPIIEVSRFMKTLLSLTIFALLGLSSVWAQATPGAFLGVYLADVNDARARDLRLSKADIVTTVTEFTAASIANAYRRFVLPKLKASQLNKLQVILGGGGTKNPTLVCLLCEHIGLGKLCTHEDFGMDSSAKEPLAFAVLAHETLLGKPGNVPSATGAGRPVVLGKIIPGRLHAAGGDS